MNDGGWRVFGAMASIVLITFGCAQRPSPATDLYTAPERGRIYFESRDTSWISAAERMRPGEAVTVEGRLSVPPGAERPMPAVVLIHGSSGLQWQHKQQYVELLNEAGIATLVIDSFEPRGITHSRGNQQVLLMETQLFDAFRALELLGTHPAIDGDRIGIAGWSRGGTVANSAAHEHYRREYIRQTGADPELRFAAHVAVYPYCGGQEEFIELTGAPIRNLLGESDDWTGVEMCERYQKRIEEAGYKFEIIVYPDAHHAFDYPGSFHRRLHDADSVIDCGWIRHEDGFTDIMSGNRYSWGNEHEDWFRWMSDCRTTGVTIATNTEAREKAFRDFETFLSRHLHQQEARKGKERSQDSLFSIQRTSDQGQDGP